MDRRIWLERTMKATGLGVVAFVGAPVLMNVLAPVLEYRRTERWQQLGPLEAFAVGEVTKTTVDVSNAHVPDSLRRKGVFVWRKSAEEVVVYSRNCTDLSCPVTWDEGSGWFYCPCHGGVFTIEGERVAGPPSRPLYRYAVRIRDGILEIDLHSLPLIT